MNNKRRYLIYYTISFLVIALIATSWIWLHHFSFFKNSDDISQHYNVLLYLHDWYREVFYNIFVKHEFSMPMFEYTLGYGSDIITTFSYYGIADPFYLLAAVVPKVYIEFLFWGLIIIRLYLAGLFFSIFSIKKGNGESETAIGAIVYCFCSFVFISGFLQLMFLNAMMYLPLVLIGVDDIFEKKNSLVFMISLFFLMSSSFYWSYMVVIFVIIYCGMYYFSHYRFKWKQFLLCVLNFFIHGSISIMLAGFIFIPVLKSLTRSERINTKISIPIIYNFKYYCHLLSHFFTIERDYSTYLGFLPIALIAVFVLFIKKENYSVKWVFIILSICLLIPYAGHVFNGFSYVSNRWTFGYAFLIAYVVTITFPQLMNLSKKEKYLLFICVAAWSFLSIANRYSRTEWAMTMLVICLIYTIAIIFGKAEDKKKFIIFTWGIIIVSIVMTETYLYSYSEGNDLAESRIRLNEAYRYTIEESPVTAIKRIGDESIFRSDSANVLMDNNQFFARRLGSGSIYYSMGDSSPGEFNRQMGILSPMTYSYNGMDGRVILETLAGVKYYLIKSGEEFYLPFGFDSYVASKDIKGVQYDVYKNKYDLPLAYAYEKTFDYNVWKNLDFADKQELVLSYAILDGIEENGSWEKTNQELEYTFENSEGITIQGNTIEVREPYSTITLNFSGIEDSETYISINGLKYNQKTQDINATNKDSYDQYKEKIDRDNQEQTTMLYIVAMREDGLKRSVTFFTPECEFYCGVHSFFDCIGYSQEAINQCTLMFPSVGTYSFDDISLYCQPMEKYREKIQELRKYSLNNISINENIFAAESDIDIDTYVCIALPYSEGWTAYIDDKPTTISRCNGMYMAVKLDAGKHKIVLKYRTPGLIKGMIISCIGFVLFIFVCVIEKRYAKRK